MGLSLKIIVPEKVVLETDIVSVILPTAMGEIEILEGHLPIIGVIEPGTVVYKTKSENTPIAVDTGFFRLKGEQVILLTEAAIDVRVLDDSDIDAAVKRAEEALAKAKEDKTLNEEELERLDKVFRFQIAQKLTKLSKY